GLYVGQTSRDPDWRFDQHHVVVAERSESGDMIDFYQVKASAGGPWTISALTSSKKGAPPPSSIIGKMYQNAVIFGETTRSVSFLSNVGFKVTDADGKPFPADAPRIPASAIYQGEREAIEDSLDADFPPPRKPQCSGILFRRANLRT
ncbi:MAG: dsDNA nuclease domain-containing protein, partial [Sphingomicrobium sp.]